MITDMSVSIDRIDILFIRRRLSVLDGIMTVGKETLLTSKGLWIPIWYELSDKKTTRISYIAFL